MVDKQPDITAVNVGEDIIPDPMASYRKVGDWRMYFDQPHESQEGMRSVIIVRGTKMVRFPYRKENTSERDRAKRKAEYYVRTN